MPKCLGLPAVHALLWLLEGGGGLFGLSAKDVDRRSLGSELGKRGRGAILAMEDGAAVDAGSQDCGGPLRRSRRALNGSEA